MFRSFTHQPEVKMQTITKVVFTPKRNAPVNCKEIEYFVADNNYSEAIYLATQQMKEDNKLFNCYGAAIATHVRVL